MPMSVTAGVCRGETCILGQQGSTGGEEVALVINTFERTIDRVLTPGFFPGIEQQNRHHFAERILLINNVEDPVGARIRAQRILDAGEVTSVHFVASHVDDVLVALGLTKANLGRLLHFSDCALVAPFVTHSSYLLYWDADLSLEFPVDWVRSGIELLGSEPDVFCATARPEWWDPSKELTVGTRSGFALGYGFSDQMFLVRADELRQPIYHERCPASARYPLSHVSPIFEQRLDSYMRHHCRYRAVYLESLFRHEGHGYYWPESIPEGLRFVRNRLISRALKTWPYGSDPAWRI